VRSLAGEAHLTGVHVSARSKKLAAPSTVKLDHMDVPRVRIGREVHEGSRSSSFQQRERHQGSDPSRPAVRAGPGLLKGEPQHAKIV